MKILKYISKGINIKMMFVSSLIVIVCSCNDSNDSVKSTEDHKIIFLHHSTGRRVWNGRQKFSIPYRAAIRISQKLANRFSPSAKLPLLFKEYNSEHGTNYRIAEAVFPKAVPYGWNNFPYDYYNIWVKNQGDVPFMDEPTLEILTNEYDIIMFKHCYPISNVLEDTGIPDINSDEKRIENYKLQYIALRDKMHEFPDKKFILWTPAVHVRNLLSVEEANRLNQFYQWIINEWDLSADNVFLWDFYQLQTEGDNFFKDKYAGSPNDSHPNADFSEMAVNKLFQRMIDIIDNNGDKTTLTGELRKAMQ